MHFSDASFACVLNDAVPGNDFSMFVNDDLTTGSKLIQAVLNCSACTGVATTGILLVKRLVCELQLSSLLWPALPVV